MCNYQYNYTLVALKFLTIGYKWLLENPTPKVVTVVSVLSWILVLFVNQDLFIIELTN